MQSKLDKISLDITYYNILTSQAESEVEHWEIVHKYICKAVRDINENGWSAWEGLIWVGLEIRLPHTAFIGYNDLFKYPKGVDAMKTLYYVAQRLESCETAARELRQLHYDTVIEWRNEKTRLTQGAVRFQEKWDGNTTFILGDQINLFE